MSVSFTGGRPHLPNGQAAELLAAIGYPTPIVHTHGEMPVAQAREGIERALRSNPSDQLRRNLTELLESVEWLERHNEPLLEWA